MKKNFTKILFSLLLGSAIVVNAQQNSKHTHNNPKVCGFKGQMVFDKDSLLGFNETLEWKKAMAQGYDATNPEVTMAIIKRNYLDFKYGYKQLYTGGENQVQSGCTNVDFEAGNASGWTIKQGDNINSSTHQMGTLSNTTQTLICNPGYTDPNGVPITGTSPLGGKFLRLGQTGTGGTAYKASQTFTVTAANSVFIYAYAVVLEDGSHTCQEQPYFNITFKDCNGNNIPCGQYDVIAGGSACSTGIDPSFQTSGFYSYKQWTTAAFDLTSYIGSCVTIDFQVAGCVITQGAHAGYCYIDASCQPMTLNLNGTEIPVGQTNNSICGAVSTNTLCAPAGFTYSWSGPGVNGQTGQCINTSSTGTFSVTLGQSGTGCFSPVLYSTFNSVPNPTVTASLTQPVCALPVGTASLNVTGGTGPYTFSWTPTAPPTQTNTNLPAGTSYTASVEDDNGCIGTTTFTIDPYPPAPEYTLSVVPGYVLSCASPSTTITFASTNTNTASQWEGPSGAITATNVVVTSPGVYTYTTINTVSTCSLVGTINITGSINLPVVTNTVTQPACSAAFGTASVSVVNGTAPYSYSWTPGAVSSATGTTNTNLPPGTAYTVSVTDDAGCTAFTTFAINSFTAAPSYSLGSNPGLALSCASPSTTLTFSPTNVNTSTTWQGPSGNIASTSTVVSSPGVYTYTALNTVSTCSVTGTFTVTSNVVLPVATFSTLCNANSVTLTATSSPSINLNWVEPVTSVSLGNPATSTSAGVFTLTATDPNNGCVQTYTTSSSVPPITVTSSGNVLTCATQSIQATTSSSTPSVIVTWYSAAGSSTVNPYSITSPGTYTTQVQALGGCSSQSVITVTTNTFASVSIFPSSTMISCATGSVSLTANGVGGVYSYIWLPSSPSYTGTVFTATAMGTYSVVALNTANGCTTTASQPIGMETIDASFVPSVTQGLMPLPVTFTNTSFGNPPGTDYSWNFGDGNTSASDSIRVSNVFNNAGTFPVVLTATNGFCQDTAIVYIKVDLISMFEVPNVFTPNGDGKNDVFTFKAVNMGEIYVIIYDRWGLKMFESTSTGNVKWDGKNKSGNTVTDGTYFYILKATGLDGVQYDKQGTINVFQ